jgi:hypothetical protein
MRWLFATPAVLLACLNATFVHAQGLTKANGREDSDIYASGTLVGAQNATTIYAFDAKFAYRYFTHTFQRFNRSLQQNESTRWDIRTRPLLEYVTNKGTRSSPDKINLGAELGLVRRFVRSPTAQGVGKVKPRNIQLVFNPRGEFDRKATTRSFVSGIFSRTVFPTLPGLNASFLNIAPLIEAGIEQGHNYRNKLQQEGSGRVSRWYAAFVATIWHCEFDAMEKSRNPCKWSDKVVELRYEYRGPRRDEIVTERSEAPEVRFLSTKPRHYADIALRIPITPYIAIKPQYKWGSQPPAFPFLDHQYTLNLEMSAKGN